jgi:hypothetical protein
MDNLNISYSSETRNSILIQIIKLFQNIISSKLSTPFDTQNKIEFSTIEKIILNSLNLKTGSTFQKFENILNEYFGNETGTEEELLSKYHSKFETIHQHLLSSFNLFHPTQPQSRPQIPTNNNIFELSTNLYKQSSNLHKSIQLIFHNFKFNIDNKLNINEQLSIINKELPQIQKHLQDCFKLLDNSNKDELSQLIKLSFSSQIQNIYSKLETHEQQIHEFGKLIYFQSTQTDIQTSTFSLLPYFSKIFQHFSQELQSLFDLQNHFSQHKKENQSFNLSSISKSLNHYFIPI